jgi:VanZ family protein
VSVASPLLRLRERRLYGPALDLWLRGMLALLLVGILATVALVVLDPGAPAAREQAALQRWSHLWQAAGAQPAFLTFGVIEWCANVVMFLPIGFLAAGVMPPRWRYLAVPLALTGSLLIELAQQFIPDRVASAPDVVANTLGAVIGALLLVAAAQRWVPGGAASHRPLGHAGTR